MWDCPAFSERGRWTRPTQPASFAVPHQSSAEVRVDSVNPPRGKLKAFAVFAFWAAITRLPGCPAARRGADSRCTP
jgi:hypothetical protein